MKNPCYLSSELTTLKRRISEKNVNDIEVHDLFSSIIQGLSKVKVKHKVKFYIGVY
ncbi:hypothetical protein AMET1_0683 [Methanonatronarchaeum thermophilum]|uniref:Uncharacterized protein n=1 Tax=Methanonatronarchaeum thermophilum TaxID=1927129 RepID=A0A1Y3GC44_9EURY|nr:hypothetical protein AMET1_0683 [Methanonatronarchaeum thermophilum]